MKISKKLLTVFPILSVSLIIFTQTAFASYTTDRSTWPTVKSGSTGGFVSALQADLWSSGLSSTVGTIDGSFGPNTKTAVESYQSSNGLTADGSVGPLTWAKFKSYETILSPTSKVYRNSGSTTYELTV